MLPISVELHKVGCQCRDVAGMGELTLLAPRYECLPRLFAASKFNKRRKTEKEKNIQVKALDIIFPIHKFTWEWQRIRRHVRWVHVANRDGERDERRDEHNQDTPARSCQKRP
jgi:hypothetical protein